MSMIGEVAHYITSRSVAIEAACKKAKDKLKNNGTYPVDEAFSDWLRLWVDAWDGWTNLIPSDRLPIKVDTIGNNATAYAGFVYVGTLADPNPPNTGLNKIQGAGSPGSPAVSTKLQTDGTIKFDITGIANATTQVGDRYQSLCYRVDSGEIIPIAVLILTVT